MKNFNKKLNDYAKLAVKVGINLQEGQPLVISAPVEGADFVRLVAKQAYSAGATDVFINWSDDALTRMKYENAPLEVFENFPKWKADAMEDYAQKGAGFLSIYAQDPELLKGIDTEKIVANNKASAIATKTYRDYLMNDKNSWCVISIPATGWAKKIFPDASNAQAIEMLWDKIFSATRVDRDDPIAAWEEHLTGIKKSVDYLNEKSFQSLHLTASNGTDLKVQLPKGHIWSGGYGKNEKDTKFVANIPTEEVYTMPHRTGVDGIVYNTKPFIYGGNLIDDFKIEFKDGKVVDYDATVGKEYLKEMLDMDEGANFLGEVALVPHSSPISQSNTVFFNTLFDENASCHLAFGKAYPTSIQDGPNMDEDQLKEAGVNDSLIHEDFMIGSSDLSIIGTTEDGEEIQVFKDGEWAI